MSDKRSDMTVERLLSDTEILNFIETHRGSTAESVKRAAEYLHGKSDALKSLKKILPSLDDKVINVFFSYKKKDEDTALRIIEELKIHSADKLQISSMCDFGSSIVGKPFRSRIRELIHKANWFVLLLPDPAHDWDWCLFEAGIFEAQYTSADRFICIHHPDARVPSQIDGYQAVPATLPDMEDFLTGVYLNDNALPGMKPLNRSIGSEISYIAKRIVDVIRPPKKNSARQIFPAWVELHA